MSLPCAIYKMYDALRRTYLNGKNSAVNEQINKKMHEKLWVTRKIALLWVVVANSHDMFCNGLHAMCCTCTSMVWIGFHF